MPNSRKHVLATVEMAYSDLAELAAKLKPEEATNLVEGLEALGERALFMSEYLAGRSGYTGCGDQGHEASVKAANALRRKVREALTFNETRDIKV